MPSPALSVEALQAGYGSIPVLTGISLDVRAGEVLAVLGPNGAGKTTLMRAIVGQIRSSAGKVRLGLEDVTRSSPESNLKRGLCMVPEGRGIFPTLTVRENLALGAYTRRDRAVWQANLKALSTERFPILGERLESPAGTLSGGQQQMLAIARALMSEPSVLLLDEPSLGLAPLLVDEVLRLARELADSGLAVLLVEQNINKALAQADAACVIVGGSIAARGPATDFVGRTEELRSIFVGSQ